MTSNMNTGVRGYFQHEKLTPIHGKPGYLGLKTIYDQVKANARSVPLDNEHGQLGLVMSATKYATISTPAPTPYTRPADPGTLSIPQNSTEAAIIKLTTEFNINFRKYREVVQLEQALKNQVIAAIELCYLKTYINKDSGAITETIPELFEKLFKRWGTILADDVDKFEEEVKGMRYQLSDPLSDVFDKIEDLERMGDAIKVPYSEEQKIKFGLGIICATHDFEEAQKKWNKKATADKTWEHFQEHFEDEHKELKQVRGKTMQTTAYHMAHSIAENLIKEHTEPIMSDMKLLDTHVMQAIAEKQSDKQSDDSATVDSTLSTKSSIDNATVLSLINTVKSMEKEIKSLKTQCQTVPSDTRNRNSDKTRTPHVKDPNVDYSIPF